MESEHTKAPYTVFQESSSLDAPVPPSTHNIYVGPPCSAQGLGKQLFHPWGAQSSISLISSTAVRYRRELTAPASSFSAPLAGEHWHSKFPVHLSPLLDSLLYELEVVMPGNPFPSKNVTCCSIEVISARASVFGQLKWFDVEKVLSPCSTEMGGRKGALLKILAKV